MLDDKQSSMMDQPKDPKYVYFPPGYTLMTPIARPGNPGIHWVNQAKIEVLNQFVMDLKEKGQIFIAIPHDLESIQRFFTLHGTKSKDSMIFNSAKAVQSGMSHENRLTFEHKL